MTTQRIALVGAGLAGCECALQLARRGFAVTLFEQKPEAYSPAHSMPQLAELVKEMGQPAFRAKQLFKWLHEKQARSFSAMTNQP